MRVFQRPQISIEYLKSILRYDPLTGLFTRKKTLGNLVAGGIAGHIHLGYTRITINKHRVFAHVLAWFYMTGSWPPDQVDHIDGDRSNNRWLNLRAVSNALNMQNQRKSRSDNSTGFLGVKKNKKRFGAKICINGEHFWLGTFDTPQEAHAVYVEKKRVLHEAGTL